MFYGEYLKNKYLFCQMSKNTGKKKARIKKDIEKEK